MLVNTSKHEADAIGRSYRNTQKRCKCLYIQATVKHVYASAEPINAFNACMQRIRQFYKNKTFGMLKSQHFSKKMWTRRRPNCYNTQHSAYSFCLNSCLHLQAFTTFWFVPIASAYSFCFTFACMYKHLQRFGLFL
jgi:hypothetical protein